MGKSDKKDKVIDKKVPNQHNLSYENLRLTLESIVEEGEKGEKGKERKARQTKQKIKERTQRQG